MRILLSPNTSLKNIKRTLRLLDKKDQRKFLLVTVAQTVLSFVDLIGVILVAVIGTLASTGIMSGQPGNKVNLVLDVLGLSNYSFQLQVAILSLITAIILTLRTILSIYASRRILRFLSRKGAKISRGLITNILNQPLRYIEDVSPQKLLYSTTAGITVLVVGVLGSVTILVADFSLLVVLGIALFAVDPIMALSAVAFFGILGLLLFKVVGVRSGRLGKRNMELSVMSSEITMEALDGYRELFVRNRRKFYVEKISKTREELADVIADMQFYPNISKYILETSIILGAIFIAAIQFTFQDARHAVASLAVFVVASSRIAPAVLRIQQGAVQITASFNSALYSLELIEELSSSETILEESSESSNDKSFSGTVSLKDVSYVYPNSEIPAVESATLEIQSGEFIAVVGATGSGKSTLIDLMLGLLEPTSGVIKTSGKKPSYVLKHWPGMVGYVPQQITMINGSIRENIALGFEPDMFNESEYLEAIGIAQLHQLMSESPLGLNTQIGENGNRLSGGEKQRLGIARALLLKPRILFLDEATSALDGKTEFDLNSALVGLKGSITLIVIAHRLSTVVQADKIVYLEKGKILAVGNFREIREKVPKFDEQATLMGLQQ